MSANRWLMGPNVDHGPTFQGHCDFMCKNSKRHLCNGEVQLLGGEAEQRSHEATGHVHRHELLDAAVVTDGAATHQKLLHNLEGQ